MKRVRRGWRYQFRMAKMAWAEIVQAIRNRGDSTPEELHAEIKAILDFYSKRVSQKPGDDPES